MVNSVVIGEGTLPVLCAKALVDAGHHLVAACSPDESLRDWANTNKVAHYQTIKSMAGSPLEFEYLFSVVNYRILPLSLLRRARRMAINYHDGPLPRYAGIRAPMWAIINGETTHGITWHVMTEEVDAGDILKQVTFPIRVDDTLHQLNLRCYFTAIAAFKELVAELNAGTEKRVPQDLSARTYFPRAARPENDCLISFAWPARQIHAFCRALDFGSSGNVVGRPKVILAGRLLVMPGVCVTSRPSTDAPGTIAFEGDALRIATATEDVIAPVIQTLDGRGVSLDELRMYGLSPGAIPGSDLSCVSYPEQM